jgi:hypothetical protein
LRVLREDALDLEVDEFFRTRPFTIPNVARLLAPEVVMDVPRRLRIRGTSNGDVLSGSFDGFDLARIVVPNDQDLGTTIIHEVVGRLELEGSIGGEPFRFSGRAVFEFLGSGA